MMVFLFLYLWILCNFKTHNCDILSWYHYDLLWTRSWSSKECLCKAVSKPIEFFFFQINDLSLNKQPSITARNEDSTAYPGKKKVTCELRMPVAGNTAGTYQFRVEISPTDMLGNLSTHVTTPTVNLSKGLSSFCDSTSLYHGGFW